MPVSDVLRIGVDVGGTNTDAVILRGHEVVSTAKVFTTEDITDGISAAMNNALTSMPEDCKGKKVVHVSIGTTHFVNAVVQRKNLRKVAIIRLCGPSSRALPPLSDFPEDLAEILYGGHFMVDGGYEFDGAVIKPLNKDEITECHRQMQKNGMKQVVISGIFSPINPKQEKDVAQILKDLDAEYSITLGHEIGHMGLLERENAAILNESLKPLSKKTINKFHFALREELNLDCPLYLTQNDGTLTGSQECLDYPVRTFASGPTNSMRGAAFLSGLEDAIVMDIGGTTTDVGVLTNGFPREAANRVKVGEVSTNFRMPDLLTIGLGGGSLVRERDSKMMRETLAVATAMRIGPESVGYQLDKEALVFGGSTVTATDVASAAGLVKNIGDRERAKNLIPKIIVDCAMREITDMLQRAIDGVKVCANDMPVIVVGGGSVLVDERKPLIGASKVLKPKYYEVANAVGAALGQVGHCVDRIVCYDLTPRDEAVVKAKADATKAVIDAGGISGTVKIVDVQETPQSYVGLGAHQVKVKAVGDLIEGDSKKPTKPQLISRQESTTPKTPLGGEQDEFEFPGKAKIAASTNISDHEFNIDSDGYWTLDEYDVECICIGAGVLGCGGGGSPYLARLRTLKLLKDGKKIRIVHPSHLNTTERLKGLVAVVGFMGAPAALIEKLISGTEVMGAVKLAEKMIQSDLSGVKVRKTEEYTEILPEEFDKLEAKNGKKIVALLCGEIGGLNAAEPLAVAAEMGIPVLDADTMGRAFPELQMCYPFISGQVKVNNATLVNESGLRFAVSTASSPKSVENFFRYGVMQMGCKAGCCVSVMTPAQIQSCTIRNSYSRAWRIGNAVLKARELKISPTAVILESVRGKRLIHGKVTDVSRNVEGGFVRGKMTVEGYGRFEMSTLYVEFQNEHLIARLENEDDDEDMKVVASVPDLISVLDSLTGEPIATEEIRYGMRVVVIGMTCSPELTSEDSLKVVGPKYFGYEDVDYEPLCEFQAFPPIPPEFKSAEN